MSIYKGNKKIQEQSTISTSTEFSNSVDTWKKLISNAITSKGVPTTNTNTFQEMADNIKSISSSEVVDPSKDPYIAGRTLVWEDDFDGDTLDTSVWSYELGNVRNAEIQVYTNSSKNVYVENSNLVIKAIREDCDAYDRSHNTTKTFNWTSGSIHTNNTKEFKYGRIEAKIKLTNVAGSFPAFWTLGATYDYQYTNDENMGNKGILWPYCGEIDIMEHFGEGSATSHGSFYSTSESGSKISLGRFSSKPLDFDEYHIYSLEWTENKLDILVDGVVVSSSDISGEGFESFKQPHFILIDHAFGGAGGTPPSDLNECYLYVDWVRVYAPDYKKLDSITLSEQNIDFYFTGASKNLTAKFSPEGVFDKTLKWESTNTSVANVYSGKVIASGEGSCVIKATNGSITGICNVNVGNYIITDDPDENPSDYTFYFDSSNNTTVTDVFTITANSGGSSRNEVVYNDEGYLEVVDIGTSSSAQLGYNRIEPIGFTPSGKVNIEVQLSVYSYRTSGEADTEGVRVGIDNGTEGLYLSLTPKYGVRYFKAAETTPTATTCSNVLVANKMYKLNISIDFTNKTSAEIYLNDTLLDTISYSNWTKTAYSNRNSFMIMARNALATVRKIKIKSE